MSEELVSRPYQVQLEEIANRKNTIIHLPTGSGKTFIAICVIKRFREALQKPWTQGGKRTFFLVNTVPLVKQQKRVIESLCPVKGVGAYSGEDGVDYWDKTKWDCELANHQVFVMTSQILLDMLAHSYIRLSDINLMIFDECHHGVVDHPMRSIMKYFESCPVPDQPRVLGLTATLLNSNVTMGQVQTTLKDLETTFHATIATVNELGEVLTYSTNPHESVVYYKNPSHTEATREAIAELNTLIELVFHVVLPKPGNDHELELKSYQHDISSDSKRIVKAVKNMIVSMINFIEELGTYGGALSILAYVILLERLKRRASVKEEELLYKFTITHILNARLILLKSMEKEEGYEKILKHSSPKVLQLLNILKEYNPSLMEKPGVLLKVNHSRKPLSAIIFTKQRFTAKIVFNLLKDVKEANPEEFGFLKHDFIVGFSINPMKSTREEHYLKKSSHQALLKFGRDELNCLISTSVIEEGVDIPQCLLVLRYDPPLEYRSYIQSKGRARSKEASFVVMVKEENQLKFLKNYNDFQHIEQYIQRSIASMCSAANNDSDAILVGNTPDRDAPTQDNIQEKLYDEDEIPPYITPQGGRLSAVLAISLLNRYCALLPHDQFTVITPAWVQEKTFDTSGLRTLQLVTIIMPVACPIKEVIKGQPYTTLKTAKRSAALNACIKLHQAGELHEQTLLPRKYSTVDFEEDNVRQCLQNWPWDGRPDEDVKIKNAPKPGSKSNVRRHTIESSSKGGCKEESHPEGKNRGRKRMLVVSRDLNGRAKRRILNIRLVVRRDPNGRFPKCLAAVPGSTKYYLHIIKLRNSFEMPSDSRDYALYKFLEDKGGFGFITQHPLPKICAFPIFTTVGEVATEIEMNYAIIKLNEQLFELVKRFHFFIFASVLSVAKKFVVFEGLENCMYVVPVTGDGGYDIDWTLMQQHDTVPPVDVPDVTERRSLQVTNESYLYSVVSPWYRAALSLTPDRYIVTNVLEMMSPQSEFDSDCFQTYADYYSAKYNLEILGPKDQPLLEVRNISSRMNCLLPRAATIREFTDKQKKLISAMQGDEKMLRGFAELFIPEFCIKFDFPGCTWYKAMLLPSIIHRIQMLLVAQELIMEIGHSINYGTGFITANEAWAPIEVHMAVTVKSLLSHIEEPETASKAVDRINVPSTSDEPQTQRPKISSMKDSLYQLQKKKLSKEYPWDERQEPIDIERNISTVTVMDIECYDEFVSVEIGLKSGAGGGRSPSRSVPVAAIKPAPPKYINKINLLLKKPVGRGPELRDVLSALTTINSHDTFCLERAETLGDSFLKFAASLYLFHKFPERNEGQLTNIKCRLISNRNLYYAGERFNLGGRMKVEQFSPRKDFLVPGFFAPAKVEAFIREKKIRPTYLIGTQISKEEALSGTLLPETFEAIQNRYIQGDGLVEPEPPGQVQNAMQCYLHSQAVSDKSVADCVEAIIGTYLLSGGVLAAVKVVEWMRIIPAEDNLATLLHQPVPTVLSQNKATRADVHFTLDGFQPSIEEIINYNFKDPSLLLEAMSHASYIRNRLTRSYERLEFLGDAILDFLITAHIFENNPNLPPGDLTDLRSALVNNVTFAAYVVKLGLHKYICKELNPTLDKAIMEFVEHQEQRNHEVVEEVLYLIDEEECQIAEYVEVPKALSDIFESIVGAIYLDSGGDLQAVWGVVYPIMCSEIATFSATIPRQPVKILYEMIHACPVFGELRVIDPDIPKIMVPVTFSMSDGQNTVYGVGRNKSQAKRAAAKLALKVIAYT